MIPSLHCHVDACFLLGVTLRKLRVFLITLGIYALQMSNSMEFFCIFAHNSTILWVKADLLSNSKMLTSHIIWLRIMWSFLDIFLISRIRILCIAAVYTYSSSTGTLIYFCYSLILSAYQVHERVLMRWIELNSDWKIIVQAGDLRYIYISLCVCLDMVCFLMYPKADGRRGRFMLNCWFIFNFDDFCGNDKVLCCLWWCYTK